MDELRRLLEAAKEIEKRGGGGEWYRLILIGIYTGLRLGDCCQLDWSKVNAAEGVIQLIPQKTRRHAHGKPVTIPIHPALKDVLLGEAGKEGAGPVLPNVASMYVHGAWQVSHAIARIFKKAGIETSVLIPGRKRRTPEATFHSLRHTFVSFAANAGVPLHVVQSIVGHESTAMTRHYYHENLKALKSAVAAIPTL